VKLTIVPATDALFEERARWRYEPPYDVYDDDGEPVLNPERFYQARDEEGRLAGFYYFEPVGSVIKYGLGLRPELTGRGLGLEFVKAGLEFARRTFGPQRIVLDVASFNERAIKVYERAGFRITGRRIRDLGGHGAVEFVDMETER
jgi:[ribosomal protein S18]-alanine N-acetyltransferase